MISNVTQAQSEIGQYLHPGERILWSGAPDPAVRFAPSDMFVVPFSVMWCGFAIFWEVGVIASGAPVFFPIWGSMFVAIGLFLVFGRFIAKARRKRTTTYVLTTERALVLVGTGSLTDALVKYQPVSIRRSRDRSHVSVTIGSSQGNWMRPTFAYANTGLDWFARSGGSPIAFYDVTPPEPLLAALEAARRAS